MKFDLSVIPKSNENIILPQKPSEDLAEETGLHIGDGTMNFYRPDKYLRGSYALRGHIKDDKEHYDKIIKQLYKKLYGINVRLRYMPSDGVYGFQKWSNDLVNFKHRILGLNLGKKIDIKIPEIFIKKEEFLIGVIRGIFDTDGCLYLEPKNHKLYPRVDICTTSEILGYQLNSLIKKFGLRSTLHIQHRNNIKWNSLYRVTLRGEEMLNKWFDIINPHNPKHIKKFKFYIDS